MFNQEQIHFMENLGLHLDFSNLSDDDCVRIEDIVGDAYTEEVENHKSEVTPVISLCEEILNKLG